MASDDDSVYHEYQLQIGEALNFEGLALAKIVHCGSEEVRIGFKAPQEVRILRAEIWRRAHGLEADGMSKVRRGSYLRRRSRGE